MPKQLSKSLYCMMLLIISTLNLFSQHNIEFWKTLFNKEFDATHTITEVLWNSIKAKPSKEITNIIKELEADNDIKHNDINDAKFILLKIRYCRINNGFYENTNWPNFSERLLTLASIAQDDYLLQSCCNIIGDIYAKNGNSDTAVFFLLKGIALAEKIGYSKQSIINDKIAASNVLYHTQNYEQCIRFCQSNIPLEGNFSPITIVSAYNNIGLCYLKLKHPDSAIFYFSKVLNYGKSINWGVWEGIASGNIGDALHAQSKDALAMPYWQKDYDSSMKYNEEPNAGLTLAYISQYQFNNGVQQKAINQLNWAIAINKKDAGNLLRIYKIKATCYRKLGLHDSADYFLERHYFLEDSINLVASRDNFNTVQMKLSFEKGNHEYQLLKKQRQAEVVRRNLLLVALLSFIFIAVLLYNRQLLKVKLAQQQQAIAEAEKTSATEQLEIFTKTLLEKNEQIEKLTTSLEQQNIATNDELIHQTLLTDYDWNKFKDLFEKIHVGFFAKLKNMAPAITQSEMRMAALIKLNLDNKQMASMQGISVSSLRGNKTRLRQKLNISVETDLENLLKQL